MATLAALYDRLIAPPRGSFFLFGVRGVGKSTWARRQFPAAHWVDLLDESVLQDLALDPASFADELRSLPRRATVVLDEVQRLPTLLNEVHRSIEGRQLCFAMLGSSARRLKTAGTNLLAGRAVLKAMYPLVPAELEGDFDLGLALRYGTIPVVWQSADRRSTLEAYVQLYVREEIRAEALVRSLPAFLRFLPVAALFHGQVTNVSAIARDTGAARATVAGYLGILQDTLLARLVPGFEPRLRVRERRHPKLYWVDPGLVRAAKRQLGPVGAEERGPLLEGYVLTMLASHNEVDEVFEDIFYWTPLEARNTEVDFVLRRGHDHIAIEVKASRRVGPDILRGLRAVASLPRLVRRILVYVGGRRLRTEDGIDVLPFQDFAAELATALLWP